MASGQTQRELTFVVSSRLTCRFLTRAVGEAVGFSFDLSVAGGGGRDSFHLRRGSVRRGALTGWPGRRRGGPGVR